MALIKHRCLLLAIAFVCTQSWTVHRLPRLLPTVRMDSKSGSFLPSRFLRPACTSPALRSSSGQPYSMSIHSTSVDAGASKENVKGVWLIGGLGNTAAFIAREAVANGFRVVGTTRNPTGNKTSEGVEVIAFEQASTLFEVCTHLLLTAPADPAVGDPFLARFSDALRSAKPRSNLQWIGYLSSTGVYGDRKGGIVDEDSEPQPTSDRSKRRVAAEHNWRRMASDLGVPLDIFRCGGIYADPSYNSTFDLIRAGTARRIIAPGHSFPRIHVDDVARAVLAAAARPPPPSTARILHIVDDSLNTPAAEVVAHAAALLGVDPPPAEPFEAAWETMTPMARTFWGEDVKVRNERTKAALGIEWRYPTYREGLAALLADEVRRGKPVGRAAAPPAAAA